MKKKETLVILPSYAVGGAEKVLLSYFQNFNNNKINLQLLVINSTGRFDLKSKKNIIEFHYKRLLYALIKIIRILKKKKFKVIISSFPHISATLLMLKFCGLIDSKLIIRQPNMINDSLKRTIKLLLLRYIYKFLIRYSDALIVTSSYMMKEAKMNGVKKDIIHLIRNPIDIKKIRKNIVPLRNKRYELKLIYVGRLVYQKGIDRVLQILKIKKKIELILIGEGVQKNIIKQKAKKLKVLNKIKFLGFKRFPYNHIAGADYFILPSRWEGLPNSVLESLSLGTPVITLKEVQALKDFRLNIKNNSIVVCEDIMDLENKVANLSVRADYKKPKLRKNLLAEHITPRLYNNKINKIINAIS